ncbi:MAG: DMT family transporter, partial [Desulfobacula sp.]
AYIFWFQGVSRVSGSTAGVFTAVMPVSAVVLSCFFLKENFTLYHAVGGMLILIAIYLMTKTGEDDVLKKKRFLSQGVVR